MLGDSLKTSGNIKVRSSSSSCFSPPPVSFSSPLFQLTLSFLSHAVFQFIAVGRSIDRVLVAHLTVNKADPEAQYLTAVKEVLSAPGASLPPESLLLFLPRRYGFGILFFINACDIYF